MEHLQYLITYESPTQKYRLGNKKDGGYVITKQRANAYDAYISAGVSDEESFSRDFIQEYNLNKNNCFAFDNTVVDYPYEYTRDITFIKKNIGPVNTESETNLKSIIETYNNIFLKMDIEGAEYPWLLALSTEELQKFKQITMEFHGINDNSWNTSYKDKLECFRKLYTTHRVIHVHGNNWAPTTNTRVGPVPNVIEITFLRKTECTDWKYNTESFPVPNLDYPNKTDSRDYILNFPPFCYKSNPLLSSNKPQQKESNEQKIPRQIFQTWKTKDIHNNSKEWTNIRDRILNKNPDYKYEFFDDKDMDEYIEKTQTEEIVYCYKQLSVGASRADFWRYIILYERGGVYLDIDSEITRSLDELIHKEDRAIISREGNPGYFLQWMMIFEPNHPILKRTIELCVENIHYRKYRNTEKETVFHITGPGVFTRAIKEYTNQHAYGMDDIILNDMYSTKQYNHLCRFYGVDYPKYGRFKHELSNELYVGNTHWQNEKNIYKSAKPICTFSELGNKGRLGNVLFQYASLLGFAETMRGIAKIPKHIEQREHHSQKCLLKCFQITAEEIEENDTLPIQYTYTENCDGGYYDGNVWSQPTNTNLHGQFESEQYFYRIREGIKKEFQFLPEIQGRIQEHIVKLTENGRKKLLGIHFRRGDDVYMNNHVYTTEEYNAQFLKRALNHLKNNQSFHLENTKIILFTGGTRESPNNIDNTSYYNYDQETDKNWCIAFMRNYFPELNVEISPTIESTIDDFGIMQQCNYFIINSTSSMAWWAGYLNELPEKQIIVGNPTNKSSETYWCCEFINIDKQ